ncbi:MAG: glycine cleavage system protein GcvH [Thermoplasmata archaeon]|nr:glycine cleavage system protein GcvH [Thermoplasmata archaeon]
MSEVPEELRYTKEHEWVRMEGDRAVVGITDHAQNELTDVVYVELPSIGDTFDEGQEFAVVESVKAASEVFAPGPGTVTEVNPELDERPELVNESPYDAGWLIVLTPTGEPRSLLTASEYRALIEDGT